MKRHGGVSSKVGGWDGTSCRSFLSFFSLFLVYSRLYSFFVLFVVFMCLLLGGLKLELTTPPINV